MISTLLCLGAGYDFNTFKFLPDNWTMEIRRASDKDDRVEPEILNFRVTKLNDSVLQGSIYLREDDKTPQKTFYAKFANPNVFKVADNINFVGDIARIHFSERNQSLTAMGSYGQSTFFKLILLAQPKISLEIIDKETNDFTFIMFYREAHRKSWFSRNSLTLAFPVLFFFSHGITSRLMKKFHGNAKLPQNGNLEKTEPKKDDKEIENGKTNENDKEKTE